MRTPLLALFMCILAVLRRVAFVNLFRKRGMRRSHHARTMRYGFLTDSDVFAVKSEGKGSELPKRMEISLTANMAEGPAALEESPEDHKGLS